jgi:HAD superfamily hydrolase (TIGR01509 family)
MYSDRLLKTTPKYMIADYEGVVGPASKNLRCGPLIRQNRCLLISQCTPNMTLNEALEYGRALQRKYQTSSYEYVLVSALGLTLEEYRLKVYETVLPLVREEIKLDENLIKLLRSIGVPKAILSNSIKAFVDTSLDAQGLKDQFQFVITAEDLIRAKTSKPFKKAYQRALEITGFEAASTVYFDDVVSNLEMPHDLGMITIQIGEHTKGASYVDYSFYDFDRALKFMFG